MPERVMHVTALNYLFEQFRHVGNSIIGVGIRVSGFLVSGLHNLENCWRWGTECWSSIVFRRLLCRYRKQQPRAHANPYGRNFVGGNPTGRFSNGKILPDYLVAGLGIKELLPAYLDPNLQEHELITGVSFSSSGTGLDNLTAATLVIMAHSLNIKPSSWNYLH